MGGFLTFENIVTISIVLVYLLYYLLAADEMKGRPRLKRLIWLVLIPSCFPITFLVLWTLMTDSFSALLPAFVISVLAFVPLVVLSEAISESPHDSTADKKKNG
jgi:hypothetical protein